MGMSKKYLSRDFNNMLIETEYVESFRVLWRQNFEEASREGLVEAIRAINACNSLIPSEYEPLYRVYRVSESRNQAARPDCSELWYASSL